MSKKIIVLLVASLIFAGCTLPAEISKLTESLPGGQKPETSQASPSGVSPSPSVIEETVPISEGLLLEITSPQNDAIVNNPQITIKGTTGATADVFINEVETKADSKGNFSAKLTLEEGENEIVIVANDAEGNYAETQLTVTYAVPEK